MSRVYSIKKRLKDIIVDDLSWYTSPGGVNVIFGYVLWPNCISYVVPSLVGTAFYPKYWHVPLVVAWKVWHWGVNPGIHHFRSMYVWYIHQTYVRIMYSAETYRWLWGGSSIPSENEDITIPQPRTLGFPKLPGLMDVHLEHGCSLNHTNDWSGLAAKTTCGSKRAPVDRWNGLACGWSKARNMHRKLRFWIINGSLPHRQSGCHGPHSSRRDCSDWLWP